MALSESRVSELTALDYYFERLRGRLVGLTDAEYLWEPAVGVPTIAWRLAHIADGLREERNWRWMGRQPTLRDADRGMPATADAAIAYLEEAYAAWTSLVGSVRSDDWWQLMGAVAGPYASADRVAFVVHIMDELIHHGAEVALLRDLYRAGGR
jgi:hypothetical protein